MPFIVYCRRWFCKGYSRGVSDRPDLGALLFRLAREVMRREEPLLAEQGVQMWDYAVLSRLADGAAPTQAQLAEAVGRDATRLIPILDRLQSAGLVERTPDPRDRRNRIVTLTNAGRDRLAACRTSIRAMEGDLLAALPAAEAAALLASLERLADAHPEP
jgi:DNA-binding MarR family transcriptional regulator